MRARLAGLFTAMAIMISGAAAADRLVVVELFTSQGCSSCPPADALLGELTARDDVLPLALHVDYWDYIGWKDSFGSPKNTQRQREYAAAAGDRTIYTPQMIVGGRDHVIGYKPMELAMLIDKHGDAPAPTSVEARRSGSKIVIDIKTSSARTGGATVLLVRYRPRETVKIRRGENAGRTLAYHNIVDEVRTVGRWNGSDRARLSVDSGGDGEVAVLLQSPKAGPILAAARVE